MCRIHTYAVISFEFPNDPAKLGNFAYFEG